MPVKRQPTQGSFAHMSGVTDQPTRQALIELERRLRNAVSDVEAQKRTYALLTAQVTQLAAAHSALATSVRSISAIGAVPTAAGSSPTSSTGTPAPMPPPAPGPGDDGQGQAGCVNQTGTGHVDPALPLDAHTAGMIVCGTAVEFSSLTDPTVDQPTRDANVLELLGRVIWHLQLAGYTAGKQQNPSGAISTDKIALVIGGTNVAYDIFSLGPYTESLSVHMIPIGSPNLVPDGGIPD